MLEFVNHLRKSIQVFSLTGKYLKLSRDSQQSVVNLKHQWAQEMSRHLSLDIEVIGSPVTDDGPAVFIGNHISYLDMPLLLSVCPQVSFVSKSEVSYWPVIGPAAKAADTVFVKRGDSKSRKDTRAEIGKALIEGKKQIAVFPSGTTAMGATKMWRRGIFDIAEKLVVKVQPFRIRYSPLRAAAYIDRDFFPTHLFNLSKLPKIKATIEFHPSIIITDSLLDCSYWQQWCEESHSDVSNLE